MSDLSDPALPVEKPQDLGFDAVSLEKAFAVVRRFVDEERIPGAVATVGSPAGVLAPKAYGWRSLIPQRLPVGVDTIFDCASLTKVVVTTTLTLQLIQDGLVRLDDPVGLWIPEFVENGPPSDRESKHRITLRHLLTHTSGLTSWAPLYHAAKPPADAGPPAGVEPPAPGAEPPARGAAPPAHGEEPPARGAADRARSPSSSDGGADTTAYQRVLAAVCRQPLARPPGAAVEYSCLGFILLGEIIRRIRGVSLDVLAAREIFTPLGMADSAYNPSPRLHQRIAATEVVDGHPILGVVHDENARAMGGVSGNAGLFSTAIDLGRFALMLLGKGRLGDTCLLSSAAIEASTQDYTSHLGGESRGLGWVIKGRGPYSSAGDLFSPESYGHTGFTGTSLWIDPRREIFAILLTNRVHPTRQNDAHIRLRALFHNAVAAAV